MNEETMDIFTGICREVMPHIDAIADALKKGGTASGAMMYLTADGFLDFTINDFDGYSLRRFRKRKDARIEYTKMRELMKKDAQGERTYDAG